MSDSDVDAYDRKLDEKSEVRDTELRNLEEAFEYYECDVHDATDDPEYSMCNCCKIFMHKSERELKCPVTENGTELDEPVCDDCRIKILARANEEE